MENDKKITKKAGAIILSSKNRKNIALLYRKKQNDWSFPKGHVEPDESDSEAMTREIKEETGLTVKILKEMPDLSYISTREGMVSLKMFLAESENDSELKLEFEGDDIKWIPYTEVVEKLSHKNLKEYFASVVNLIEKNK